MKKKSILQSTSLIFLILVLLVGCHEDFSSLDTGLIGEDDNHFLGTKETFTLKTYNQPFDKVQSNNLPYILLGEYSDQYYGTSKASFVSSVTSSSFDPDFGTNPVLDSVVITIPYFSSSGEANYELDSIFPRKNTSSELNLSIYESNYFLKSFDPDEGAGSSLTYFSDFTNSSDETINPDFLRGTPITQLRHTFTNDTVKTKNSEDNITRLSPRLRVVLESEDELDYWKTKILDKEGSSELFNSNNFQNYFRGIYVETERVNTNDTPYMIGLDFSNEAQITLNYTHTVTDSESGTTSQEQDSFVLSLNNTSKVNFFENSFSIPSDPVNGDDKLYLKGGDGGIAKINLFNGFTNDEDHTSDNSFEAWRKQFAELDPETGEFIKSKRLVNEAHIIFYVDQPSVIASQEPNRIYMYDVDNNLPLRDYFLDNSTSNSNTSIGVHLGPLEREDDEIDGNGVRYKIRVTEHINNLILRDSTNVTLGLAISGSVNLEGTLTQNSSFETRQNTAISDGNEIYSPVSSIITPRGTVLEGSNSSSEDKRPKLIIYYTEPENN